MCYTPYGPDRGVLTITYIFHALIFNILTSCMHNYYGGDHKTDTTCTEIGNFGTGKDLSVISLDPFS